MKKGIAIILVLSTLMMAGCTKTADVEITQPVEETEMVPEVTQAPIAQDEDLNPAGDEDVDSEYDEYYEPDPEKILNSVPVEYDRKFLTESNGTYVYNVTDIELIAKYDELYADAFREVHDSYDEIMSWQNESFDFNKPAVASNLVMNEQKSYKAVSLGSNFEMDFGFDLNNVGYTYVDLDSDGSFELIFGVLQDAPLSWIPVNCFERAYTHVNGKPMKICEGGSRDLHWLGSDGFIYEEGSGGASYSGIWRLHFDKSLLPRQSVDWGTYGFVEDEFVGYWEEPVHIVGPITDMDEAAKLPENLMEFEEMGTLSDEWASRQVEISWIRLTRANPEEDLLMTSEDHQRKIVYGIANEVDLFLERTFIDF